MTNIENNYMILGYNNRKSAAIAAILNKKNSSAGILGDFSPGCLVGIQVTFLKISAFYIFFPGWTLMLLGYIVSMKAALSVPGEMEVSGMFLPLTFRSSIQSNISLSCAEFDPCIIQM